MSHRTRKRTNSVAPPGRAPWLQTAAFIFNHSDPAGRHETGVPATFSCRPTNQSSIERLRDNDRRFSIVGAAIDDAAGVRLQDRPHARHRGAVDALLRIPEIGPNQRPGALHVGDLDVDHDDALRRLVADREPRDQLRIDREPSIPVDSQCLRYAGNHEEQPDRRADHNVPQTVEAVVAPPVRQEQRRVVGDLDPAGAIAAGRAIGAALRAVGGEQDEGGGGDVGPAMVVQPMNFLVYRPFRGRFVDLRQFVQGRDVSSADGGAHAVISQRFRTGRRSPL